MDKYFEVAPKSSERLSGKKRCASEREAGEEGGAAAELHDFGPPSAQCGPGMYGNRKRDTKTVNGKPWRGASKDGWARKRERAASDEPKRLKLSVSCLDMPGPPHVPSSYRERRLGHSESSVSGVSVGDAERERAVGGDLWRGTRGTHDNWAVTTSQGRTDGVGGGGCFGRPTQEEWGLSGALRRAAAGINGFEQEKAKKRLSDRLYSNVGLTHTYSDTNWTSSPKERRRGGTESPGDEVTMPLSDEGETRAEEAEPSLTEGQLSVVNAAMGGKSIFFTGSAGTGKSFTLRVLVEELKLLHGEDTVFVTASTGLAACNIGGATLHSFAGVGLGTGPKEEILAMIKTKRKQAMKNWRKCQVLIVDEISMISGELLSKIDYVGRSIRDRPQLPFGGVQVIFCGDFLQLPPVKTAEGFAFEAPVWKEAVQLNIELREVIRQKNVAFVEVLNEIRLGRLSSEHKKMLMARSGVTLECKDGIEPTRLYPHRKDVTAENRQRLAAIRGEERTYFAVERGDKYSLQTLDSSCQAPRELKLKVGAQVMLLKNISFNRGLFNGSRGIVVGYREDSALLPPNGDPKFLFPVVRFDDMEITVGPEKWEHVLGNKVKASRTQIPLVLAWAISIHKSQGMSINKVALSLANVFTYGQAYVALSRVTSLEGLSLTGLSVATIKAHPRVLDFYRNMVDAGSVRHKAGYCPMTEEQRLDEEFCQIGEEEFALDDLDHSALDALEDEAVKELALSQEPRQTENNAAKETYIFTPPPDSSEDESGLDRSEESIEWNTQEKLTSSTAPAAVEETRGEDAAVAVGEHAAVDDDEEPPTQAEKIFIDLT